ncbi:MAG TPA: hypothetical protein VMM78_03415 [Thermomicrobiales bacterium]|nr:hypothetical protein [Thermomicrobiales bacterium]
MSGSSGSDTTNIETGAGSAVGVDAEDTADSALSHAELVARLEAIRPRVMPLLQAVQREYRGRARDGHPRIIDNVQRGGIFGLELDPGYGVYFMTDGTSVYGELHAISHRTDTLSNANVEKFAGSPDIERREIDAGWTDHHYRNIVSELLNRWNYQQLRIFRVDS